ncbi:MAG: ATPase [Chromatiales bacterium]|nr:ATPase [Chromatiales bacterium]
MYLMLGLIGASLLGLILVGVYLEIRPRRFDERAKGRWKATVAANLTTFVIAEIGLLAIGIRDAMAQTGAGGPVEVSVGMGLAFIGIGIPTGLAAIGAGIAVGPVGAASLALISEKPEMFGRTLIYLGLAEGIAIYGLVVTILMLGRLG